MRRRAFIASVGGAVLIWALAASAQSPDNRVRILVDRILRLQAEAIAEKVDHFIKEVEGHLGWAVGPMSAGSLTPRRLDFLRLLRQVQDITEVSYIDTHGREQIKASRLTMDKLASGVDFSQDPKFTQARANKRYVSPVYFRNNSEPYITLAIAGSDGSVTVAEVNLKAIQDMVAATRVGDHGVAFVVDTRGRVIAHSDIGVVQRDFSELAHVQAAQIAGSSPPVQTVQDINGRQVLAAYAIVARPTLSVFAERPTLRVFVELPVEEATK
jgi:two-component system NtrC family sensor kinase